MRTIRISEKGQILVLLVLVLIGLLGFTALAVDGGMIYADRRFMQSAADAASLAGAGEIGDGVEDLDMQSPDWSCTDLAGKISDGYVAAENQALTNDFTIALDSALGTTGHDNGVFIICDNANKFVDVFVMLTRNTNTSFVHLFTGEQMKNTVTSISRIQPGITAGNGNTIVSLSLDCGNNDGGVHMGGTTNVELIDGGIWSNSCTDAHGTFDVLVEGGDINYHCPGDWCPFAPDGGGSIVPTPSPVPGYHALTPPNVIPDPGASCWSDSYNRVQVNPHQEETISPGNYSEWSVRGTLHLNPGLYCVNDKITMTSEGTVDGSGVTIYFTGSDLTINGGMDATLEAPNGYDDPPPFPPDRGIEDLLIYVPLGIDPQIKINGNSGSVFGGTIYAPSGFVTINGNAETDTPETEFYTSIIAYDVNLTGASNINFNYDATRDYGFPTFMEVRK